RRGGARRGAPPRPFVRLAAPCQIGARPHEFFVRAQGGRPHSRYRGCYPSKRKAPSNMVCHRFFFSDPTASPSGAGLDPAAGADATDPHVDIDSFAGPFQINSAWTGESEPAGSDSRRTTVDLDAERMDPALLGLLTRRQAWQFRLI